MVCWRCGTKRVKAINANMVQCFDNRRAETDDKQRFYLPSTSTADSDVCCAYSLGRDDTSTETTDNDRQPDTSLASEPVTVNEKLGYTEV
jgi:hypothetical protein